jgi:DNA-binding PadR family transcriptional regulator
MTPMQLPTVTALQTLVIRQLIEADKNGRTLRADVAAAGKKMSGPAFYELMARIEDAGLVRGRYVSKVVDGCAIRERWYHLEAKGQSALDEAREFYRQ